MIRRSGTTRSTTSGKGVSVVEILVARAVFSPYEPEIEAVRGTVDEVDAAAVATFAYDCAVAEWTNLALPARHDVLLLKPSGGTINAVASLPFRIFSFGTHAAQCPPSVLDRVRHARARPVVVCSGAARPRLVAHPLRCN